LPLVREGAIPFLCATRFYELAMGTLQFPFRRALGGVRHISPVHLVRDPTDLIALPFTLVAFAIGHRRAGDEPRPARVLA